MFASNFNLRRYNEAHVTAVAAAAAAQRAGGVGPAAAAAAHALGVALDASGRLHVAPEWATACLDSADADANVVSDVDHDHCGATAYAAAVACSGAKPSVTGGLMTAATRACAVALSSLASPVCATANARCVARTADAMACSPVCGASLSAVSRHCGGFVLRAEHGAHADVASEACSNAVRSAQAGCDDSGGGTSDATCVSLLEAVPAEEHHSVHEDTADAARAHVHHRVATLWGGQHARGVLPTKHLCGGQGHLDLRDNVLLGSVPACAWAPPEGREALLLSRNLLSGTMGRLGAHVRHVHASENRLTGDLAAALGGARDLEHLDVAHNRLSGDLGVALAGADPAVASTLRRGRMLPYNTRTHPSFTPHTPLIHLSYTPHTPLHARTPLIHTPFILPSYTPQIPLIHPSYTSSYNTPHTTLVHPSYTPNTP